MKKVKVEEVAKVIEAAKAAKGAARTKEVKKLRRLVSRQYYARTMVEYVIRQCESAAELNDGYGIDNTKFINENLDRIYRGVAA